MAFAAKKTLYRFIVNISRDSTEEHDAHAEEIPSTLRLLLDLLPSADRDTMLSRLRSPDGRAPSLSSWLGLENAFRSSQFMAYTLDLLRRILKLNRTDSHPERIDNLEEHVDEDHSVPICQADEVCAEACLLQLDALLGLVNREGYTEDLLLSMVSLVIDLFKFYARKARNGGSGECTALLSPCLSTVPEQLS